MSTASLMKHLKPLTSLAPKPLITWDKHERIVRNKEIWDNPKSIVHRLPKHYQERYWRNHVLCDVAPVHYEPPKHRLMWDTKRLVEIEMEHYPIVPLKIPEQDKGLWGGESVVKGYRESRPFTRKKILPRHWIPRFWFPELQDQIFYSEVLDKYYKFTVTQRALKLIDDVFGLDFYLLKTPEIDINSKLGMKLKRTILVELAANNYYQHDKEKHNYILDKYAEFVMPLEEAEWVGLTLNEACRKQQDIEDNLAPVPEKYLLEKELLEKLAKSNDLVTQEADYVPKTQKSLFGEKILGKYMKPLEERLGR